MTTRFEHGQVIRLDYGISEYWVEAMVIRNTDKHYITTMHRKSHNCIECPDKWKLESLESYGRIVLDLRLPTTKVTS